MKRKSATAAGRLSFIILSVALLIWLGSLAAPLQSVNVKAQEEQDAPLVAVFSENFDNVVAPALPSGWTSSATGSQTLPFVTTTTGPDSAPNCLYANTPLTSGTSQITSPSITLGSDQHQLIFRHHYQTDFEFDGGVLEISIGAGVFRDIITAGGVFIVGGYSGSSLAGSQSWTGQQAGYITTKINLPANTSNQTIRFRWRTATDSMEDGPGWRIDNLQVVKQAAATTATGFSENFDGVNAPQLPVGWTTATTGGVPAFVTATALSQTAPNSAFISDSSQTGTSDLISPTLTLNNNPARLFFRHAFAANNGLDGGVLEIKVGAGAFQDVLAAGGSFAAGGYTGVLTSATNPLNGQSAWTGSSSNNIPPQFIGTIVNLPPSAAGQTVQFRWRQSFDQTPGIAGGGWWIDNVRVENFATALVGFVENFDSVAAPQLPANWTSAAGGDATAFATRTDRTDSPTNSVYTNAPATASSAELVSPPIRIGANSPKLIFRHAYNSESSWDGGVLEIKIGGGAFQDILAAGGSFVAGAYRLVPLDENSGNLIGGRRAWTGLSGGTTANPTFITTEIDLPSAAYRQTVQFRWLHGTDDSVTAAGASGWWIDNVQVTNAVSGENELAISIPTSGAASSYPSEITVTGHEGLVSGVKVSLTDFSHTAPDDVDLMLVAPNGRKVVLMSDVGGANEASNLNISFDDSAFAALPDNSPLASGNYKPTNFEPGDAFPAPAPGGAPNGSTLSAFFGSPANGAWKLYVVDDNGENFGSIADGFSVNLQTSLTACLFSLSAGGQGFPITGGSGNFAITMPAGCPWSATTNSSFISFTSNASGEGNGTLNYTIQPNFGGGRTASIVVSNGVTTQSFLVQQPSGCPFSLASTAQSISAAGGTGSVAVTAGSSCAYMATSSAGWIQITSGSQTGDGMVTYTVQPNPTASLRSGTIIVGARTFTVNQPGATGRRFDYDGDGKADLSVFRPSNSVWYVRNSQGNNSLATPFGAATDRLVPADYDGDRKTDHAVFRNGAWYLLESRLGIVRNVNWGASGDVPVTADYDGDGRSDIAVWRPSDGTWYIIRSSDGVVQTATFGASTDQPVPADYDGDGRADVAVYRAGAGSVWYILQSGSGSFIGLPFGTTGDIAVAADYDGDGRDNIAVFRPSNGTWYFAPSSPSGNYDARTFGAAGDIPVAADYNGDGRADVGVVRGGIWYILMLGSETFRAERWGAESDIPVPAVYNRQ